MRLSLAATTISLALALSAGQLHASALVLTDTSEQLYRYDDSGNPYFSEAGISGEEATVHMMAGEAMPLGLVAELVVPDGWHINIPTKKVANMLVSVNGGKTWSHILREIAEKEKMYIGVDWTSKVVAIDASDSRKAQLVTGSTSDVAVNTIDRLPNYSETETKYKRAHRDNEARVIDSLQNSNNASVLSYADTLQRQKAERDQASRELAAKQELLAKTNQAARASVEESELKLGELTEQNMFAINEKARLERELEAARLQIDNLSGRLRVVGEGEDEELVAEDLFAQYERADVLPFNASFDYYIKGGYMDNIEYKTPATYIAKPNSLETIIRAWAEPLGFAVQWKTPVRHIVPQKLQFKGDLREASTELFSLFLPSDRPLNIYFYPDVGESGLIVVEDLNNQERSTPSLNWINQ